MRDNLESMQSKFSLEFSKRFAGGSMYRCKKCGALAHSIEVFLPCQNDFVPSRVWCNECKTRWALSIEPTEEELKERVVN